MVFVDNTLCPLTAESVYICPIRKGKGQFEKYQFGKNGLQLTHSPASL